MNECAECGVICLLSLSLKISLSVCGMLCIIIPCISCMCVGSKQLAFMHKLIRINACTGHYNNYLWHCGFVSMNRPHIELEYENMSSKPTTLHKHSSSDQLQKSNNFTHTYCTHALYV